GKLVGSDPKLKDEYVVLSAHLDHLGIGQPINDDRIYNGAMDNAAGCAALLDIAESIHNGAQKPRRSVLFLFVTGEEKGLLGSQFFAAHPTVEGKSMVADLNSDMFLPIIPLKVLTVFGLADSDLGDIVRQAAQSHAVQVQPDPEPLRNAFVRSDQYNFVRHGIPAVAVNVGFVPGSPEQKIHKQWLTERYHAPSDDLNQPVDLATAAGYEEIMRDVTLAVADENSRPHWKPDSFFKQFAAGAGE
ncbi:MAG TPA: M20/M25/M40 family metallo-hydrolase, partial [Terriglobales bacterium]|nr:M20/M25/M40 family metallo-hydrolase [Terriglobales bacterium]